MFCVAGFRPGRRGPFVPEKGTKTIDAPSGLIGADGRQSEEGAHLAPLTQGPAADESVPPLGQTAGVGPWETTLLGTLMNKRGALYSA